MGDPSAQFYGLDLIDLTHLKSGTLYPLLHRLVIEGWLERSGPIPSDNGGPPRFNYKLTGVGAQAAARILAVPAPVTKRAARHGYPGAQPV